MTEAIVNQSVGPIARLLSLLRAHRWSPGASCVIAVGVIVCVARFSGPAVLSAETAESAEARYELMRARSDLIDDLAGRAASAQAVLAIAADEGHPFVNLLLWVSDDVDPGAPNRSELLLISQSRVLQTLTAYRYRTVAGGTGGTAGASSDSSTSDPILAWSDIRKADFCDRMRTAAAADSTVLARDVSDLLLEMSDPGGGRPARLRIGLIWGDESADAELHRTADVSADLRSRGGQGVDP